MSLFRSWTHLVLERCISWTFLETCSCKSKMKHAVKYDIYFDILVSSIELVYDFLDRHEVWVTCGHGPCAWCHAAHDAVDVPERSGVWGRHRLWGKELNQPFVGCDKRLWYRANSIATLVIEFATVVIEFAVAQIQLPPWSFNVPAW